MNGLVDDPLAFLPQDSDAVIGVDLERLRASPAWRDELAPMLKQSAPNEIAQQCGYDPATQIKRISFAFKELDKDHKDTTVVIHGLNVAKLECGIERVGQNVRHDGAVVIASDASTGNLIAAMPLSADAVLLNIAPSASKSSLESRVRSGAPLRNMQTFIAAFGRLESSASAWAVINPSLKSFFGRQNANGAKSATIDMTFTVTDRYVLAARILSASENAAAEWMQLGGGLQARSRGWVEKMEVTQDGPLVRIEAEMKLPQTQTILWMIAASFGIM